jgi:DNA-binding MarR family transcriptional regulator
MASVPKYISDANRVLAVIASEPGRRWTKPQRELGDRLGLRQPVLSYILRLLENEERIERGEALPTRGRTYVLIVVDASPVMRRSVEVEAVTYRLTERETETGSGQLTVYQEQLARFVSNTTRTLRALEDSMQTLERSQDLRFERMGLEYDRKLGRLRSEILDLMARNQRPPRIQDGNRRNGRPIDESTKALIHHLRTALPSR